MTATRHPNTAPAGASTGELYAAEHWMGARDAAAALNLSRLALYERALGGEIATVKVAGRRLFARADIAKLAARLAA